MASFEARPGVIPYKDHPWQSGRLPARMRVLAQEGRLMCLRWKYLKARLGLGHRPRKAS